MEFDVEALKRIKQATLKCINDLGKKTDLNPAETKAALDGFDLLDRLCYEIEDCEQRKKEEEHAHASGYSDYAHPRRYSITSYGMPRMRTSHHMPEYYMDEWRDDMEYANRRGYSRHSIGDRVVALIEKEMDTTDSAYEREELQKFIRMIRASAD